MEDYDSRIELVLSGLWLKAKGLYIPITNNQVVSHGDDVKEALEQIQSILGEALDTLKR